MKKQTFCIVLALSTVLAMSHAHAQKMYKWVDEDGNVHFSDQVPPDQVDKARDQINTDGITVDSVERAKTAEELAAEKAAREEAYAAKVAEEKRLADEKKLLDSYASAEHIMQVRDEKLIPVEKSIKSSTDYLASKSQQLSTLMDRAASQERAGKPVNQNSKLAIERARAEILELQEFIERKKNEREALIRIYDEEYVKYNEIVGRKAAEATEQSEG